jgi:hypothetical protein
MFLFTNKYAKFVAAGMLLIAAFLFGYRFASLKWEARYADSERAKAAAVTAAQKQFDAERQKLELLAASLRAELDNASAVTERMRLDAELWRSRAKGAKSQFTMECLSLLAEERGLRETGTAIIQYCQKALPEPNADSGKRDQAKEPTDERKDKTEKSK